MHSFKKQQEKSEILNPKSETNPNVQNPNDQNKNKRFFRFEI